MQQARESSTLLQSVPLGAGLICGLRNLIGRIAPID